MTLSGVWRGALDCCAKKAHHPLWTVVVDSSVPKWHIQHWRSLARNRKTRDQPALFRRLTGPAPVSTPYIIFHPLKLKLCGSPVGYPNPCRTLAEITPTTSLYLLWKYQRRPRTRKQSLIHNIIRRHTQLLAVILYIILYCLDTNIYYIIWYKTATNTYSSCCIHAGLHGVNVPQGVNADLHCGSLFDIVVFNPQTPKSHCLFSVKKAPN